MAAEQGCEVEEIITIKGYHGGRPASNTVSEIVPIPGRRLINFGDDFVWIAARKLHLSIPRIYLCQLLKLHDDMQFLGIHLFKAYPKALVRFLFRLGD